MPSVNIVVTSSDLPWICGRLARELEVRLPRFGFDVAINGRGKSYDIEYHANAYFAPSREARVNIALFAQEDGHVKWVPQFDGHVVLNPFMRDLVTRMGATQPVVIEQAVDVNLIHHTKPNTIFGVAGSVKRDGRKGEALVKRMVDEGYRVLAWGQGWPCPIIGHSYTSIEAFYDRIDYYVVTSTMEGGCTPIIEAMAMGKPVISPRLGFAIVRPVLEYEKGSWESLHGVLRYLTEHRTYEDWAKDHAEYFRRFL